MFRFLLVVLLAMTGTAVEAKGKAQVPKFIQADNGLMAAAALRGGDYLTKLVMHFAGQDPPLEWVGFPKTADLIPAWMDEPVAAPAAMTATAMSGCGKSDFAALAEALKAPPPVAAPTEGLIHFEAPAVSFGADREEVCAKP